MSQRPTCSRCHRPLKSAESIARGRGKTCDRRARAELVYTDAQRAKAHEVVEMGAIAATPIRTDRGRRVFVIVASSGAEQYFTTRTACTCASGLKGRQCYHRLAVALAA